MNECITGFRSESVQLLVLAGSAFMTDFSYLPHIMLHFEKETQFNFFTYFEIYVQ